MQAMVPTPPPYYYHADEDCNTKPDDDPDNFPFQQAELREPGKYGEPGIDKISPDEDERTAEAALHAPGMCIQVPCNKSSTNSPFDKALLPNTKTRKVRLQVCQTLWLYLTNTMVFTTIAEESHCILTLSYSPLTNTSRVMSQTPR